MTRPKKLVFVDGKKFSSQSYRVQILIRLNKGKLLWAFHQKQQKNTPTNIVLEVPMYQNFISTLRTYIFQNLTYNTWKKDNSSDCYQLIIHRIVLQLVHKSRYIPGVRQRNCEKAAKFRASCIRILRHLKVIFEVTKAKNIGEANEFWLSQYELQN